MLSFAILTSAVLIGADCVACVNPACFPGHSVCGQLVLFVTAGVGCSAPIVSDEFLLKPWRVQVENCPGAALLL